MKVRLTKRQLLASASILGLSTLSAGTALAQDCPIKIGALAPLSAPGTVVGGEAMRDAMMLAETDINDAGGVMGCDIEVVIGDSEGLPERAVAVMERLITQDGVVAVGGGYHSSVGVASKDVANSRGIPVVFAETWNDTITGDKQKYIFRIAPLSSWASAVIWQFALTLPDVDKVVILTENTDYGIPASEETAKGLESGGVGIGPLDLPFVTGQDALESGTYWTNVPDGQYAFIQRVGVPESQFSEKGKAFAAAYKEKTGKSDVESYAMEAYDSIAILAQAIGEAGSTDGDSIVAALETIEHEGTLGKIYFPYGTQKDPSEDERGDEWWHQWPDPALTMIQYTEEGQTSTDAAIVYPDSYKTAEPVIVNE